MELSTYLTIGLISLLAVGGTLLSETVHNYRELMGNYERELERYLDGFGARPKEPTCWDSLRKLREDHF
jgi:hypothetical protein